MRLSLGDVLTICAHNVWGSAYLAMHDVWWRPYCHRRTVDGSCGCGACLEIRSS